MNSNCPYSIKLILNYTSITGSAKSKCHIATPLHTSIIQNQCGLRSQWQSQSRSPQKQIGEPIGELAQSRDGISIPLRNLTSHNPARALGAICNSLNFGFVSLFQAQFVLLMWLHGCLFGVSQQISLNYAIKLTSSLSPG
jgi:hypothetical protein